MVIMHGHTLESEILACWHVIFQGDGNVINLKVRENLMSLNNYILLLLISTLHPYILWDFELVISCTDTCILPG